MKKTNPSLPSSAVVGKKKITSKIDTGRRRIATETLTTTTTSNVIHNSTGEDNKLLPCSSAASSLRSTLMTSSTGGTFPRSQKQRPSQPSKDPKIRAFVKANARVTNMTALFHDEVN